MNLIRDYFLKYKIWFQLKQIFVENDVLNETHSLFFTTTQTIPIVLNSAHITSPFIFPPETIFLVLFTFLCLSDAFLTSTLIFAK